MAWPTFIVIGGMKCGTTSLYEYLRLHPQVDMGLKKELNYFSKKIYEKKRSEWYRSGFNEDAIARGDVSPFYLKTHLDAGTPARIHSHIPQVKLICLLRDPVARFLSHYRHCLHRKRTQLDANAFVYQELERKGNVFLTGCYGMHLDLYLQYFDRSQFLLLRTEDLYSSRRRVLREVFDFIGVDKNFVCEGFNDLHHVSDRKSIAEGSLTSGGHPNSSVAASNCSGKLKVGGGFSERTAEAANNSTIRALEKAYAEQTAVLASRFSVTLAHYRDASN